MTRTILCYILTREPTFFTEDGYDSENEPFLFTKPISLDSRQQTHPSTFSSKAWSNPIQCRVLSGSLRLKRRTLCLFFISNSACESSRSVDTSMYVTHSEPYIELPVQQENTASAPKSAGFALSFLDNLSLSDSVALTETNWVNSAGKQLSSQPSLPPRDVLIDVFASGSLMYNLGLISGSWASLSFCLHFCFVFCYTCHVASVCGLFVV